MSDSKKIPGAPPPDDFSKTTPNINLPDDVGEQSDWNKTNYNMPKQPPSDDWGKTVANIKPIDTSGQDFDKTYFPGAKAPSTPEWGVTNARVDVGGADFGTRAEDFGGSSGESYDKTTPYFKLPESERAKYQKLPPTPSEQAAQEEKQQQEKGGLPGWFWVLSGLVLMFFFAIIVLGIVYFIITPDVGYVATIKGAPAGSRAKVDGSDWGVSTDEAGTIKLQNLKEGATRKIEIVNPAYICQPAEVRKQNGVVTPDPIIAQCKQVTVTVKPPGNECADFKPGDDAKAERCYNVALDAIDANSHDSFTAEELVRALSILIINFNKGKYDVPPARMANLQRGSDFIKRLQQRDPNIVLQVGGHTDSDGNDASNMKLSENRANAVKKILVGFGVNANGLQIRGYGATQPKSDNTTEQGKFQNRRIQYSVVKTK